MKLISRIILVLVIFITAGCANGSDKSADNELVTGGLYLSKNKDGSFGVSKVLALDEFAVHVRMYSDKFESKPVDLNSSELDFFIGHAPMSKEGFMLDKPELLKVEKVTEKELEGYHYYLEAMKNQ